MCWSILRRVSCWEGKAENQQYSMLQEYIPWRGKPSFIFIMDRDNDLSGEQRHDM